MLVFWKARLVMLAVPKTGTSAYARALGPLAGMVVSDPPELKHSPVFRYNRFFRPMFERVGGEDLELLAVVREPVDWLGSWYRYRQRAFLDDRPTSTKGITFDAFCDAYARGDRPAYADVGSQAKFVEPRPNGIAVTHLFKYENQSGLIAFLEDRLQTRIDLPRENVSPPRDLSLSPATEEKLHRKCAADFEVWESAR
ncbi:gamma-glutamyl kinase [Antarctobacter jejuensis]|uniref:gamma-glutamyl kinase n=1 Tax=Antarctobacter jejuensis TaxID=1439938 RepID=UPI003FD315FA